MLDLLDAETGRRLVLDDESLHLIVGKIARPDDRNAAPRRVADPPLLAIENPGIAFTLGGCGHTAARSRTDQWLGEAEATDLFVTRHLRQPLLLLLLGAIEIDRAHRQAAMYAPECTDRGVDACNLHRDEAE